VHPVGVQQGAGKLDARRGVVVAARQHDLQSVRGIQGTGQEPEKSLLRRHLGI
jgi:hypothetical protein